MVTFNNLLRTERDETSVRLETETSRPSRCPERDYNSGRIAYDMNGSYFASLYYSAVRKIRYASLLWLLDFFYVLTALFILPVDDQQTVVNTTQLSMFMLKRVQSTVKMMMEWTLRFTTHLLCDRSVSCIRASSWFLHKLYKSCSLSAFTSRPSDSECELSDAAGSVAVLLWMSLHFQSTTVSAVHAPTHCIAGQLVKIKYN